MQFSRKKMYLLGESKRDTYYHNENHHINNKKSSPYFMGISPNSLHDAQNIYKITL
ncbi:hypothetical protein Xbud_01781 [Xenorhabdus budapestensis]|uniref:Uncharacterized protein n=1 Tax=Xenorhabdus budapestensis TaxID=290110 RepID=A0A2D0J1R0_XENBU|nr:hypothetical protein Xbud_01781 [Xenorhabdus budapestensis]